MDCHYRLEIPPTAIAAPGVVVQLTAGTFPVAIVGWRVGQVTKLSSEIWQFRWTHKSAAATVTTLAPTANTTSYGSASAAVATTGTYRPSGGTLGTDGVGHGYMAWNLINAEYNDLLLPADQIEIQPGETVALNLLSTPAQSTNIAGYVAFIETR